MPAGTEIWITVRERGRDLVTGRITILEEEGDNQDSLQYLSEPEIIGSPFVFAGAIRSLRVLKPKTP